MARNLDFGRTPIWRRREDGLYLYRHICAWCLKPFAGGIRAHLCSRECVDRRNAVCVKQARERRFICSWCLDWRVGKRADAGLLVYCSERCRLAASRVKSGRWLRDLEKADRIARAAELKMGELHAMQGRFFTARSCLDCGRDCFGKGRKLCRRCLMRRKHTRYGKGHIARARHHGARRESGLTWRTVAERDGNTCHICFWPVPLDTPYNDPCAPTLDHALAFAGGGAHTADNVRLAHRDCNSRKQDGHQRSHRTVGDLGIVTWSGTLDPRWTNWACEAHGRVLENGKVMYAQKSAAFSDAVYGSDAATPSRP